MRRPWLACGIVIGCCWLGPGSRGRACGVRVDWRNGVSFVLDSIARFGSCRGLAPCCLAMIPAPTPCCAAAPPCSWPQAPAAFSAMDEDPAILSDGIKQRLASCWTEPSRVCSLA
ncbi:hypothetical protein C2845_PM14G08770 [Panicum miliaceum]|uniref:Secreted protein n=1 Tax=Panicum miliaceum TaxID=4540 RepID=A0A3L6PRH2_PANMI|nr:hypothetical protein C2845_PM14G08770 [Panicum miliaceum]